MSCPRSPLAPSPPSTRLLIGHKRTSAASVSRTNSLRTTKRPRTTALAVALPAPDQERLAKLHAAAFDALREAVASNDDGLVQRMREWERRHSSHAPRRPSSSSSTPAHKRRRRAAYVPRTAHVEDDDEEDEDELIIHTSPGAGLASAASTPLAVAAAVSSCFWPHAPSAPLAAPIPSAVAVGFTRPRDPPPSSSSSSDSDDDASEMVWESSSSPYMTPATSSSSAASDLDLDDDLNDNEDEEMVGGATEKAIRALRLALASGWGGVDDYEVDAILALQHAQQ
ncbi:hypothetical protein EXIGLDRAFT_483244 [Exidia glandulosa HHB12029]|uniref:Uncharacterized protein n=1 Tax=Exidia glandulosa HHB12029 TaxID=1314781 RepID=A0A166BLI5_EXIGL|nr:hypothetical protein EXIGLDRAFT_483244 [Exidia glandulosa HHB12029]